MSLHIVREVAVRELNQVHGRVAEDGNAVALTEFPDPESLTGHRPAPTVASALRRGGAQGPTEVTVLTRVAAFDA